MLSKDEIIKLLNDDDNFVDSFILDAFIKNWKIEAIYEDENGVEFFDEAAFEKIKAALVNKPEPIKQEPVEDLPIIEHHEFVQEEKHEVVEPIVFEQEKVIEPEFVPVSEASQKADPAELKNFTLDITNQTLNVLAKSIADKITDDISGYLKKNEWLDEAFNAGSFKKDNEVLAAKLNEILNDNKVLIKRIQELEAENDSFVNVFANIYVKKSR